MFKLAIFLIFFNSMNCFAQVAPDLIKAKEGLLITISRFESAILSLNKTMDKKKATRLATLIAMESKRRAIDPRIFLAILNVESSFNQSAISKTGDISIAQFNIKVWTPATFKKKTGHELDHKRLKTDEAYAISRMGILLAWLKENHAKQDKWWFARYHSSTPHFKKKYIENLTKSFQKMKPFGRNLLKDMPSLDKIAKLKLPTNIYLASNDDKYQGKYNGKN